MSTISSVEEEEVEDEGEGTRLFFEDMNSTTGRNGHFQQENLQIAKINLITRC